MFSMNNILGFIKFGSNNAFSQGFVSTWNKFQFDLCKEVNISTWRANNSGAQDVFHDKVLSCSAGKLLSLKLNLKLQALFGWLSQNGLKMSVCLTPCLLVNA